MLKVGLTGGIGCGKSTAVDAFRGFGVPIVDADIISKDIVSKGKPALEEIEQVFGADILLSSGELNRALLKEKIFANSQLLITLEEILHPLIRTEISKQIRHYQKVSNAAYVIVDIPLLVEKSYQDMFDRIIVVDCLPEQQFQRVIDRDGMPKKRIIEIMKVQSSREDRLNAATDVLNNSSDKEELEQQVSQLHQQLTLII